MRTSRCATPATGCRTAAVCDCFGRLCAALGRDDPCLGVLRGELLRSIYEEYAHTAPPTAGAGDVAGGGQLGGGEADATSIGGYLKRTTYFERCRELRAQLDAQEERLESLQTEVAARDAAAHEADALLREARGEVYALREQLHLEREARARESIDAAAASGGGGGGGGGGGDGGGGGGLASQLGAARQELSEARRKVAELSKQLENPPAVRMLDLFGDLAPRQRYQVRRPTAMLSGGRRHATTLTE